MGQPLHRVLFVCVENSNRSQMAEAFARIHGRGVIEPHSAGSRPSGAINPRAIEMMRERGYDLSAHASKPLTEIPEGPYAAVITMGCGDACPWIPATRRDDWDLSDPKHLDDDGFRAVRDDIERRVLKLIEDLRNAPSLSRSPR